MRAAGFEVRAARHGIWVARCRLRVWGYGSHVVNYLYVVTFGFAPAVSGNKLMKGLIQMPSIHSGVEGSEVGV